MSEGVRAVDKSFLEWLYQQDNIERLKGYADNEKYYDGDLEIRIPSNVNLILEGDLGYTSNLCRAVVDAAVGFLSREQLSVTVDLPRGEVAEDEEGKKALEQERSEAEAWVYEIFRDSKLLFKNFVKALRIQAKKGELALKAYPVIENEAIVGYKISVLRPDICFPKWKDEEYEELEYFAIKYPRSNPETGKPELFAQVIWPDEVKEFTKPIGTDNTSGLFEWKLINEWKTGYDFIPVEWVSNKSDDGPWSEADITDDLKDVQDAFNKLVTDLLYTADQEAFRTTFLLGASPPKDDKGNPKPIKSGPGKFHWIPTVGDKNPQLGYLPPSNFEGLINSMEKMLDLVSVISKVPKNELSRAGGTGNVPTGIALKTIYQPFIGKCDEKRGLLADGLNRLIAKLFNMAEVDKAKTDFPYRDYVADVTIAHGLPADEKERAEVLQIEGTNRWKSRETIMGEIGIEDVAAEKETIQGEMDELALYRDQARIDEELAALEGGIGPDEEL